MKYTKPEVVALGTAVNAVKGSSNKGLPFMEEIPAVYDATHPAYEADE
jgi:hypothetical protein